MTAQVGETLHYEGREVVMCNEPLGDYFKLVGIEPEFDANCTALWRGYPLLRELIREAQPSLNEVRAEREAQVEATERSMRTFRAGQWRQIRARLFSLEVADRLAIRLYWDRHRIFPGDPVYLAHVIRQHQAVSRLK